MHGNTHIDIFSFFSYLQCILQPQAAAQSMKKRMNERKNGWMDEV